MSGLPVRVRLLLVLVVLSNVTGNLFLTLGVRGGWEKAGWLLLGVGLLILWTVSRMSLLSWADLSYVLPVTSIGYVLSAVCGKYFFDDDQETPDTQLAIFEVPGACIQWEHRTWSPRGCSATSARGSVHRSTRRAFSPAVRATL